MEESPLDFVAHSCTELTSALSSASEEADKETVITNHIKKVWNTVQPVDDFKKNLHWTNVSKALSLKEHCQNKIVILDFFTYCCINCFHILGDLKELEKQHSDKDGVVVIGVHSAKFDNEKDRANLEAAVLRYGITHPVVNDCDALMWNKLGIQCWPTLLILGPENKPIFMLCGEGHKEELLFYVNTAVKYFKIKLSHQQLPIQLHNQISARDESKLYFPSKLAVNPFTKGQPNEAYMAISDTGNHRVLLTDYSGTVLKVVGGPEPGFKDGDISQALLNSPQGLCWLSDTVVVVCDTGNHSLRTIHLDEGKVELLAGTGKQSELGDMGGKFMGIQALSSPWDVVLYTTPDMDLSVRTKPLNSDDSKDNNSEQTHLRRVLLIAMAGSHQIWALFMDTTIWWKYKKYSEGTCICIVGSGQEAARNSSYPAAAALAQPSGLTLRSNVGHIALASDLLVADSESSSIRKVSLHGGQVSTLAGGDRNPLNLFAYGDVDAIGFDAKFQHPLAVAYCEAQKCCYVADTYNHKIKRIDMTTGKAMTNKYIDAVTGEMIKFSEPSGLCVTPDQKYLYVADTNNHSIKILNLNKNICERFRIKFVQKPKPPENLIVYNNELFVNRKSGTLIIYFNVNLDNMSKSIKVSDLAPQYWNVVIRNEKLEDVTEQFDFMNCSQSGVSLPGKVEMRLKERTDRNMYKMDLSFKMNLCEGNQCFLHRFTVRSNILVRDSVKMVESYKVTCRVKPDSKGSV